MSLVLDGARYEARVANAGLIAPLLWRAAALRYIESFGLPLGATHGVSYSQQTVALQPGDCLLLVSDGIVEAMNDAQELWGFERLEAVFGACGGSAPATIVETILAQVRAFMAAAPPHDDMTMVVLQVRADSS